MRKTMYYTSFEDDLVDSTNQDYKLKDNYKWVHKNPFYVFFAWLLYIFLTIPVGLVYTKLILRVKYKNRKVLRKSKLKGYFLYSNHTQAFGDVVMPAIAALPKRIYTVVSPANFALPVIGRILTMIGALPTPNSINGFKQFRAAYTRRIRMGHPVIIYPDAHLWPYYTKIRPFKDTSFRFPVELKTAAYVQTVTYQKRRFSDKAKITIYYDGPFYPDETLSTKEAQKKLHDEIYNTMLERAKNSNYEYYNYMLKNESDIKQDKGEQKAI